MSHAEAIASPLALGATFQGRYKIIRCIKAGGMGAVYEVIHLETKRRRALKVMLPSLVADPELRARFRLEATITAEVETEHIVETFDAGVEPETGAPFLVMELLKGQDLAEILEHRRLLPANEVVTLLSQLAVALDKTHAVGIVHRDLKPENLFVTERDDGSPRLKVLDFGIAKMVASSTHAKATARLGTPLYMAPEQLKGDTTIGPGADLYAMGHLAFVMLTGRPYWEEEALSPNGIYPLLIKVAEGSLEPASARAARLGGDVDPRFDAWFAKATALKPSDRFGSATELVAALAESLGVAFTRASTPRSNTPPRDSAVSDPPRPALRQPSPQLASTQLGSTAATPTRIAVETMSPRGAKKSRVIVLAVGGALLALGIGTAVWVRGRPGDAPAPPAPAEALDATPPTVRPTEEIVPSAPSITPAPTETTEASGSAARPSALPGAAPPPRPRRPSAPASSPTEPADPTRIR